MTPHTETRRLPLVAALALAAAASAHAQAITGTIDTSAAFSPTNQSTDGTTYFNAPSNAFPSGEFTIGEFDFTLPKGTAVSGATFSGNFGSDTLGSGTAPVDLFVDHVEVARCDAACAAATQSADVAWSFTFSAAQLGALAHGQAILTAVQEGPSQVVLDPTSVTIATTTVPEPASGALLASGLAALLALAARRKSDRNA